MEKFFAVAERGSNPAQEFRLELLSRTAYIIAVNPAFSLQEFQRFAAITATCLGGGT